MLDRIAITLKRDGFIAIDPQWRADRAGLHTSAVMLEALRKRFVQDRLHYHAHFEDGAGTDNIAFTFLGIPAQSRLSAAS